MTDSQGPFRVDEAPRRVAAWPVGADSDRVLALMSDVRRLIGSQAEQRRAGRDAERKHEETTRALLLGVIEIIDGLDRILGNVKASGVALDDRTRRWMSNFRTVRRLGAQLLEDHGVKRIENLASGFDPVWHSVLETVADRSQPEGTISEELQPGYVWRTRVLRKAGVRVVTSVGDEAQNA